MEEKENILKIAREITNAHASVNPAYIAKILKKDVGEVIEVLEKSVEFQTICRMGCSECKSVGVEEYTTINSIPNTYICSKCGKTLTLADAYIFYKKTTQDA